MQNIQQKNLAKLWVDEAFKRRQAGIGATIVFPESQEARTVAAVVQLLEANVARRVVMIGDRAKSIAALQGSPDYQRRLEALSTQGAQIEWTDQSVPDLARMTRQVLEVAAAAKGKTLESTKLDAMSRDPLYQAGALVRSGHASCALAGAEATTAAVIRAALSTVGLADGLRTASGSFIMEKETEQSRNNNSSKALPPKAILFADSGVVADPDVDQLVDIAAASVATWESLVPRCGFSASGTKPVVAFLSFSTKGSANHPSTEKMAKAASKFSTRFPEIRADGELQFDAATDPEIARRKCPSSPVAGEANILIFPDLDAGNIAYKITQRLAGFNACGPILQGLAQPYSDLSRGSTTHDIFLSALACLLRA
jgi:phosphate acetyltransferase